MIRFGGYLFVACVCVASAFGAEPEAAGDAAGDAPKLVLRTKKVKGPTCDGKGSLVVRPPDMGQYEGRMENIKHWDKRLDPCPTCGGKRRVGGYDMSPRDPVEGVDPCPACGWSGLKPCRRCKGADMVKCTGSRCKEGWIVTPSHDKKHHPAPTVRACSTCKGVGRMKCLECRGMGATPCPKCFGTGRKIK